MGSAIQSRSKQMRMYEETISSACLRLIKDLSSMPLLTHFYLVGGTALSLQLGHRKSIDLDFFTSQLIDYTELESQLPQNYPIKIVSKNKRFLKTEINKVRSEFIYFAYEPKFDLISWNGINMITPVEVGLYKLLAILGRSTKKDIVDLYFIDKEVIELEKLFELFLQHFDKGDIHLFNQIELLFIPEKIESTDIPEMLVHIDFNEALHIVKSKILQAIRKHLGIDSLNT